MSKSEPIGVTVLRIVALSCVGWAAIGLIVWLAWQVVRAVMS